jgi:two-component system, cell cycle response regulator
MHIVVVDPSRTIVHCLQLLLEARDHHVYPFTDGVEALRHIESNPNIDGAMISAEQACGSGIELCWQTRLLASPYRPIYVILISSHDARRTLIEALDSGADDFISKPPFPEELYARLRAAERVTSMQRELARLAATDPLTGVLNRRAFFERSKPACDAADVDGALSAILIDIDHFKTINDTFGHPVGDQVIRAVCREAAQTAEIVGRLGGEEFAMLLPATLAAATEVAEQLRGRIAALRFDTAKGPAAATCSFGVSEWQSGGDIDELLRRADVALYAAKTGGRNRVVADRPGLTVADYDQHRSVIRTRARTNPPPASGTSAVGNPQASAAEAGDLQAREPADASPATERIATPA